MGILHAGVMGRADAPDFDAMNESMMKEAAWTPEERAAHEAAKIEERKRWKIEAELERASSMEARPLLQPIIEALQYIGVAIEIRQCDGLSTLAYKARMGRTVTAGKWVTEKVRDRKGWFDMKAWKPEAIPCIATSSQDLTNGGLVQIGVTHDEFIAVIRPSYGDTGTKVIRATRNI